jgi:hypothetical protein
MVPQKSKVFFDILAEIFLGHTKDETLHVRARFIREAVLSIEPAQGLHAGSRLRSQYDLFQVLQELRWKKLGHPSFLPDLRKTFPEIRRII